MKVVAVQLLYDPTIVSVQHLISSWCFVLVIERWISGHSNSDSHVSEIVTLLTSKKIELCVYDYENYRWVVEPKNAVARSAAIQVK
jgi:hypothetical protein